MDNEFVTTPRRRNRRDQNPQQGLLLLLGVILGLACIGFVGTRLLRAAFSGRQEPTEVVDLGENSPLALSLKATATQLAAAGEGENPPPAILEETAVPGTPLPPDQATLAAFYQGLAGTQTATLAPPTSTPTATTMPPVCVVQVGDGDFLASILDEFSLAFEEGKTYFKYADCKRAEEQIVCTGRVEIDKDYSLDVGEWVEIPKLDLSTDECEDGNGRMTG